MVFLTSQSILDAFVGLFNQITKSSIDDNIVQNEIKELYEKVIIVQSKDEFIFFWEYIFAKLFNDYLNIFISSKMKDSEFKKSLKKYKELRKEKEIEPALEKKVGPLFDQDSSLLEICSLMVSIKDIWNKSTTYCQYCYNLLNEKLIKNKIIEKKTDELDNVVNNCLLPENYNSHLIRINHLLKQFYSNRDFNPDKNSTDQMLMKKYLTHNIIIQELHSLFKKKKLTEIKIDSDKLSNYLRIKIASWQNILLPKRLPVLLAYYLKNSSYKLKPHISKIIFAYDFRKKIDFFIDKIDKKIK